MMLSASVMCMITGHPAAALYLLGFMLCHFWSVMLGDDPAHPCDDVPKALVVVVLAAISGIAVLGVAKRALLG